MTKLPSDIKMNERDINEDKDISESEKYNF